MAYFNIDNCKITAMAAAVPDDFEKTTDYYKYFDKNYVDKFIESTGVNSHYTSDRNGITASDLCCAAAEKIFLETDIDRKNIDALIFMSATRDYRQPVTACVLHDRLDLSIDCMAYDVPLGCSAYVYGLYLAASHINSGCRSVLLLSGTATEKKVDNYIPESIPMLYGSAGSATLIEATNEKNSFYGLLRTKGAEYKMMVAPFGASRHPLPIVAEDLGIEKALLLNDIDYMSGMDVMRFSLTDVVKLVKDFKKHYQLDLNDFDLFVPHQANKLILTTLAKKIKMPLEKVPLSIERYANTVCASIPLSICDYFANVEQLQQKVKIATCGFGIGLSFGIVAIELDPSVCLGVIKIDESYDDEISYDIFQENS